MDFELTQGKMKAARLHTKSQTIRLAPLTPIILILLGLLMVFGSGEASGQMGPNDDRYQSELEQTDRIIEDVKELLAESANPKAEQLLGQAMQMQDRAWDNYRHGSHQMLGAMIKQARDLAAKALGLMQRGSENLSFVEQQLERTQELIDQARGDQAGQSDELTQTLLEQAQELQDRAREFMQQQRLRQALQFSLRARKITHEMMGGPGGPERRQQQVERFVEQLQQQIDDLGPFAQSDDNAQLLLDQARTLFERAQEMIDQGHWEQAISLLSQCAGQLRRARHLGSDLDENDAATQALQLAQARLDRLRERATELNTDAADDLLDEAAQKLQKAQEFQDNGDSRRALVTVRVVMELLQNAERILSQW